MNVLVLAEDFVKDEYVLQPIIKALMKEVGKPRDKVVVCKDPRFRGTSQALNWVWIQQALDRHRGMVDLFLLCVDRDGDTKRYAILDKIEMQARDVITPDRAFFAVQAWQELEVWVLAGHDLPTDWKWNEIRSEPHPKERFYLPFAQQRGVIDRPAEGRGKLASEAAARYDRLRRLCDEDVAALELWIEAWLKNRAKSHPSPTMS